jgi:hypothetical protein
LHTIFLKANANTNLEWKLSVPFTPLLLTPFANLRVYMHFLHKLLFNSWIFYDCMKRGALPCQKEQCLRLTQGRTEATFTSPCLAMDHLHFWPSRRPPDRAKHARGHQKGLVLGNTRHAQRWPAAPVNPLSAVAAHGDPSSSSSTFFLESSDPFIQVSKCSEYTRRWADYQVKYSDLWPKLKLSEPKYRALY